MRKHREQPITMMVKVKILGHEWINSEKEESAANTITVDPQEVPNSSGAREVYLVRVELDPATPEYVANTSTSSRATLFLGKQTTTSVGANQVSDSGCITSKNKQFYSNGTAGFAAAIDGPPQAQGRWRIPRNGIDNKYYVTGVIQGIGNSSSKMKIHYRCDFDVIF